MAVLRLIAHLFSTQYSKAIWSITRHISHGFKAYFPNCGRQAQLNLSTMVLQTLSFYSFIFVILVSMVKTVTQLFLRIMTYDAIKKINRDCHKQCLSVNSMIHYHMSLHPYATSSLTLGPSIINVC